MSGTASRSHPRAAWYSTHVSVPPTRANHGTGTFGRHFGVEAKSILYRRLALTRELPSKVQPPDEGGPKGSAVVRWGQILLLLFPGVITAVIRSRKEKGHRRQEPGRLSSFHMPCTPSDDLCWTSGSG